MSEASDKTCRGQSNNILLTTYSILKYAVSYLFSNKNIWNLMYISYFLTLLFLTACSDKMLQWEEMEEDYSIGPWLQNDFSGLFPIARNVFVSVIHFLWIHEPTLPVSTSLTKDSLHSFILRLLSGPFLLHLFPTILPAVHSHVLLPH